MSEICCSCNGSVDGQTCVSTGKLGRHCFNCGFKDHVPHGDSSLFRHGIGVLGFKCPQCGTTDAWMGNANELQGNVVGGVGLLWT